MRHIEGVVQQPDPQSGTYKDTDQLPITSDDSQPSLHLPKKWKNEHAVEWGRVQ